MLNKYPDRTMKNVTVPKNMPINLHVITFLSKVASGSERPTTAIIKDIAVPNGMPFATNTSMTGTIPAAWHTSVRPEQQTKVRQTNYLSTCIARKIPQEQNHA